MTQTKYMYTWVPVFRGTKKHMETRKIAEIPDLSLLDKVGVLRVKRDLRSMFMRTGRIVPLAEANRIADNIRAEAFAEALTGEIKIPF
jgi:hypothetical protein